MRYNRPSFRHLLQKRIDRMVTVSPVQEPSGLAAVAAAARAAYAARIAGGGAYTPWWTAVIITASSARQAARYEEEIRRRRQSGTVPAGVTYLVVPDLDDARIGSGGATLNAVRVLVQEALPLASADSLEAWWATQRVFIIHSGGDSRRLPQYSLSGKLFSALPVKTPWGEVSTVFDEMLALSTAWAERMPSGLAVASGDVILTFDAAGLHWDRPGVSGVAMRESTEVGARHGVYVADEQGRVYTFLQKPSALQVREAGGLLEDGRVALDSGLMRFDAPTAARLTELGGVHRTAEGWTFDTGILVRTAAGLPAIDLYEHVVQALTGQWQPAPDADPCWHAFAAAFRGVPFWCDLVDGEFTHIGTTTLFRQLMTEETSFSNLYAAQQRLGAITMPGLHSAGVVIDSAFTGGGSLGTGSVAIECALSVPVRAGHGAILHGLTDLPGPVDVPDDVVLHQVPVALPDGTRGTVIRVYGVDDDPKGSVSKGTARWFGRPILETMVELGLDPELAWEGVAPTERTLWNARLFPVAETAEAWACACWILGAAEAFTPARWTALPRLSLAYSARYADSGALAELRNRRMQVQWQTMAVSLAEGGSDVRPLLAAPPSVTALAAVGRTLAQHAGKLQAESPTEAASRYFHAGTFLGYAGLLTEADTARGDAFGCVRQGVDDGVVAAEMRPTGGLRHRAVTVAAPARIDFGGGWSDTPPFCLDWGGTVLNMAVALRGEYPIVTTVRRLAEPVVRCISDDTNEMATFTTMAEMLAPPAPGSPYSIPRVAVRMCGILDPARPLDAVLRDLGGGLEITMAVRLPMGSGLGTSSILAATVIRALAVMLGIDLSDDALADQVMRLEQLMTTGGGWQDQAGGIFPGTKLILSGPGLRQRLRVQPVAWAPARQAEFADRFLLYYTGIRRIAKNLLAQVVGSYLAREVSTVQVLHSIKTLASEMAYAMTEGEWDYLGSLLDRHWRLNQVLDPNTTNAPITHLLQRVAPHLSGAKLAGAGGGGFLMLLAKSPEDAARMHALLADTDLPGAVYEYAIANEGLRVTVE
jgi:fucokinase